MRRLVLSAVAVAAAALATAQAARAEPTLGADALKGPVTFKSPSGNIGCALADGFARCDIDRRDWSPPAKPASCPGDYGQGLTISRSGSRGRFVCAGDTALGGRVTLGYGRSLRRGGMRCTSRESGMTCKNRRGHGFRISRRSYRRF